MSVAAQLKAQRLQLGNSNLFVEGWKKGVLDANDKLYAAKMSGALMVNTIDKIFELLNILLEHPPEAS